VGPDGVERGRPRRASAGGSRRQGSGGTGPGSSGPNSGRTAAARPVREQREHGAQARMVRRGC
jgi:hypothetical protein